MDCNIGGLAMDLQNSAWIDIIVMIWHLICGLCRDWWFVYGLVDWSRICIGVADWSKG